MNTTYKRHLGNIRIGWNITFLFIDYDSSNEKTVIGEIELHQQKIKT